MTRSPLWRELESGDNILLRLLRRLIVVGGFLFLLLAGVLEMTWPQQALLGLVSLTIALWMNRASTSYLVTLTLMLLSCFATFRYGYWRISTVVKFFREPVTNWNRLDAFFICLLLAAEFYSFAILFLGYVQTLWPLRRMPVPLPDDLDQWPEVDLLIPTYNEPLNVVRYTALAAMNIDWPADKLNVYILDDGKREEFRAFAEEAGIGYMTREDNAHAKAGNINHALERLDAPFVAIFDCDHVPTRSFLQLTMGWFGRDAKLGLLQTPHHFYSPDPFERNLGQFRVIPNEGELFYGVVQDGNDFWNATFFCGSCAVLRRSALDEIGGMAVETVTEDAHTSLRMQMRGWNTAYINIPQAAGLATERLSGHVQQRIRWARGMVQILRIDNPLFAPGLNMWQRLCYFNAMTHFLYALPRLIFLTAPLIYLIFGHTNIPGYWAAILAFAVPHLVMYNLTNSRIQGQHRHSFWNEIYETVLAPYILLPTMLALINPKLGRFNVTAKGGVVDRSFFDTRIAQPFLALLFMNGLGLLCAVARFFKFPAWNVQPLFHSTQPVLQWLANLPNLLAHLPHNMYDGGHPGTIFMNVLWTLFNIAILGVATAVAWESQQRRHTVRVTMAVPADVLMPDGTFVQAVTTDLSSGGVMLLTEAPVTVAIGAAIDLVFPVLDGEAMLPATVVAVDGRTLRAHFDPLTMQEEEALTMVLYSRADTWLGWGEAREADKPLVSMWHILQLSFHGLTHTVQGMLTNRKKAPKTRLSTSIVPLLLLLALVPGVKAQDPAASSELTGELLPQQNELKLLPLPFYDARVNLHPPVQILFISQPSAKAVQAAGIVASWFGILGNSHAMRFPVTIGSWLPLGNVVVISESAADLPALLGLTATIGPTIAMRTNPSDPNSKALVLTGDNADDLLAAAQALALNSGTLAGTTQGVRPSAAKKREPDDAPRWLSTDRLTTLGEAAQQNDLQGDGSVPIQTYFRLPPDLYLNYGSRESLPFRLDYRYDGIPPTNDSSLQVYLNEALVGSVPMPRTDTGSKELSATIPLPIVELRPFSNSIKMQFNLQTASGSPDTAPTNVQGEILKSSSLDIRGVPHWAQMPNLEIFANAGYPFTRLADLAETVVVLPDQPSSEELEMFLTLMGHFGAQTGYPVLNVTVINADGMKTDSGKDYLLMGTVDDLSAAIAKVSDDLPVKVGSNGLKIEDTHGFFANAWWKVPSSDSGESGKLEDFGGALPDALVEGIEWPRGSGKSVVLIALRDKTVTASFLSAFLRDAQASDISQSVSVLKGDRFVSRRVGNAAYTVGSLPRWIQVNLRFQQYPWLPAAVAVFVCFLMAVLLRAALRRRARRRLLGVV
jgi:cellulose synthase catalytic subunit (UDP-forming)